ncbi:MAG: MFS transporter [Bacteroidia bacterium]|nr:MFS transporter [Bacteroidia bacterium]MBP9688586.1 MFS transporter [Bacteroidia bacterium]
MNISLNNKKVIFGWTMYDWANSVFSLTVTTAIFPPYFNAMSKIAAVKNGSAIDGPYQLSLFGHQFETSSLYSFSLSLGFLVVALLGPILSGIADARGNKKSYLKFFCYLGSISCMLMFFFNANNVFFGLILFIMGLIGFSGSIIFYNAYLPEIVTADLYDRISARGYSMGYIGSVILLLLCLLNIMNPSFLFPVYDKTLSLMQMGASKADAIKQATTYYETLATRLSFVTVGVWWMGFAQITFSRLPNNTAAQRYEGNIFNKGFKSLKMVWVEIKEANSETHIKRYLWGFFFTSMGLQTVMYMATLFGSQELKLKTSEIIITVLIIQLIAILGAWAFARVSEKKGNIFSLIVMVLIWIAICIAAYFVNSVNGFYILAGVVGLVMGGIQSMFRSTYAKLIPANTPNHVSYFSFYDVCEKFAIVLGTLSYGIIADITGTMRLSAVALSIFFIIGLFFLARIKNIKTIHTNPI